MNEIIEETIAIEGGYVNDPTDRGGETYKGISRKFHSGWEGWAIIDGFKQQGEGFEVLLNADPGLHAQVVAFYEKNYMRPFEQISNRRIKAELFDTAVNMGVGTAKKMLQEALNLMNRNERNFEDLAVDGQIGPKTIAAYKKVRKPVLFKVLNGLQFCRYKEIVEKDPRQERFFNGWMKRV